MRVLILTQWYPPEPALLMQDLAQSLQARGHDVTVLTGFPNYPSGELYPGYRLRPYQRETLAGVPVVRVPLYPDHSRSGPRRILNYTSFALSSAILGPWLIARPDVLFVYHPPLTIGATAYWLSRLWRVPFVYQVQDLWPESLRASGMVNSEFLLNCAGTFAAQVYCWAAAICVISPGFRANLIEKGVPPEKIRVVSNWVNTDTYYPAQPDLALAGRLGLEGKFNVMFAGNVGEGQGLETLVDAAELLQMMPTIQFVVVGDGSALPHLQRAAETKGLDNIRFLGRFPAREMPALYALADVLLVHLKDHPIYRVTIPHKIFAYMASGKPVVAAVEGDAADVVLEAGAGLSCPPSNPTALAGCVMQLADASDAALQSMGLAGLKVVRAKYSRDVLTTRIEELLRSVVDSRR